MFEKYINNQDYEIQITLSQKYSGTQLQRNLKGGLDLIKLPADMDVIVVVYSTKYGGEVDFHNGKYNYMTISEFKKYCFGNKKIKNLKIYRLK